MERVCVRFRAELQGPLVAGFHQGAGHGSLPLRNRRLLLGFIASCLLSQPVDRVLDDVRAADAKRVEELGFDIKWDAILTSARPLSTDLTHREAGKMRLW